MVLFTPKLVLEVAEAAKDSVITQEEFSSIVGVLTGIFMGVMIAVFIAMLMKGVTKETGIGVKKVAGVSIPIYD